VSGSAIFEKAYGDFFGDFQVRRFVQAQFGLLLSGNNIDVLQNYELDGVGGRLGRKPVQMMKSLWNKSLADSCIT
jgi:hypothetical protein